MPIINKNIKKHQGLESKPVPRSAQKLAHWLVKKLYGREMHISGTSNTLTAASVVFWYNDHGIRKFLMLRDVSQQQPKARFAGCLETSLETPLSQTLFESIQHMFGKAFARTVDETLLEEDKVKAAPTLSLTDQATGKQKAVQGLVWLVQIAKPQIELCESMDGRFEVVAVPEFAMTSEKVAPAHKVIYQAVREHFPATESKRSRATLDRTKDHLEDMKAASKTLH